MLFTPVVYEHAAALINRSPWDVSRDPNLLYEAHKAAYETYNHSPIVVGIDIYNLEAEAYGAAVDRPEGNGIPVISRPICASVSEIRKLKPFDPAVDGRISMVLNVAKRLSDEFPNADVRIPVSGPFSIAGNLTGFESLVMESMTSPADVTDALEHLVDGQLQFIKEISNQGLGVSFFESGASPPLVSPDIFTSVILPPVKRLLTDGSKVTGSAIPFIVGGDTIHILDAILSTGTKYIICPAETDQQAFMDKMRCHPDVTVRVNMTPSIVSHGTPDEIRAEVDRIAGLIDGFNNACIGTGPLPYETPVSNVFLIRDYLDEKIARRLD